MLIHSNSEEEYTNTHEEHVKPTAFLFAKPIVGISKVTSAEKYIIMSAFHPITNSFDVTLEEVDEELKKLDFLTFDWGLIPKQVFKDLFNRFTYVRLVYFCAHFHIHLEKIDECEKQNMVNALCEHFNKK